MAENPAISVIVPMYKVEQYIKFCVDSILNQTFQDFEIILVDDASPDGCLEICQKLYGDNDKVNIVRHDKNLGLGPARNTGMKHARGKYICFVDSDDFILPQALEKLYNVAEKNNAQIVHENGCYDLVQNEVEPVREENLKIRWEKYSKEGLLKFDPIFRLEEFWAKYNLWSMAWLCFCRRDFMEENHIEFLPIISEDETFSFALFCLAERYYVMHEAIYIYRRRSGSIMRTRKTDRLLKGIQALVLGASYLKNFLDNLPKFDNYEQRCADIMNKFFDRFVKSHTAPHYTSNLTPEVRTAVYDILIKIFGENAFFVRKFFNGYNFLLNKTKKQDKRLKDLPVLFISESPAMFELMTSIKSDGKRIFLMGTPRHGNLGDQAIVLGEQYILSKYFTEHKIIEIPYDYLTGELGKLFFGLGFEKYIRRDDIIFLVGGGNLGNLWLNEECCRRLVIEKFPENKIVIFPQSIHFTDDDAGRLELANSQKIYNAHKDLHLMTRDENSFELTQKIFPSIKTYLLPDSATALLGITDDADDARAGVLFILRVDKEKARDDEKIKRLQNYLTEKNLPFEVTDNVIGGKVTADIREQKIREVLLKIRRSKLVITDRFHGVIFSFITRTPVLAFKSFDTKISSGIKWFKNLPSIFYAEDKDGATIENFIKRALYVDNPFPEMNTGVNLHSSEIFLNALNQIFNYQPPPRLPELVDNRDNEPRRLTVDKISDLKFVECLVPISHCNLHCEYCYVIQRNYRDSARPKFRVSPQEIGRAFNPVRWNAKRLFVSFCGAGETFLCKEMTDIVAYTLLQGNFVNVTNNGTIKSAIKKLINLPDDLVSRLVFAFSFHYKELKNRNLLNVFAENVKAVAASKASFTVQLNLYDGYLDCLDEIKNFSMENFGALPQIPLTRDQRKGMKVYCAEGFDAYKKYGAQFNSPMFDFSCENFLVSRAKNFCYAGECSYTLNLATGALKGCYSEKSGFNIYNNLNQKVPSNPIGHCRSRYCVNAIHFMALGIIPEIKCPSYAELRDRPEAGWYKQSAKDALGNKFFPQL